jgi:hypothetical protein
MEVTMSATDAGGSDASVANIDMKLEVVVIPVSDVDREGAPDLSRTRLGPGQLPDRR